MKTKQIPVWLVTGYLGSGKTTLLVNWLRDQALANAALVVNEIGEVALDDKLLARAVDSAALITNSCVCCTGLLGLEDALVELWWDRLYRRRPRFDAVVIETTGLANPQPIIASFDLGQALAERFQLAAVITTVNPTAGTDLIASNAEAQAQIIATDVVVIDRDRGLERPDSRHAAGTPAAHQRGHSIPGWLASDGAMGCRRHGNISTTI